MSSSTYGPGLKAFRRTHSYYLYRTLKSGRTATEEEKGKSLDCSFPLPHIYYTMIRMLFYCSDFLSILYEAEMRFMRIVNVNIVLGPRRILYQINQTAEMAAIQTMKSRKAFSPKTRWALRAARSMPENLRSNSLHNP